MRLRNRRRIGWPLAPAALLLCLALPWMGCGTDGPPNPVDSPGRVYLIRGQGWVFSGGWRTLRDRLRRAGIRADDLSDLAGSWPGDDILADRDSGQLAGPIVLVGHSRGGRQALFTAGRLGRAGVAVDLVLTLDVAMPPPVPAGVQRAVNLYRTRRRLYPARPLKTAGDCTARIENIDLDAPGSLIDARGLHHLNITDSPGVQDELFLRIAEVMRGVSPRPGSPSGTSPGSSAR
jgi:hypothetical protein